jgi:RNA polymerase sigma-70 factor (ECF subfamily)
MDEQLLIQDTLDGNLNAFNQLVLHYQDMAYNVAYRIMGEHGAADDATQEAFISAYEKLEQYRGGSFKAWLLRIVTNSCYDELRRRQRQPVAPLKPELDDGDTLENPYWIKDDSPSPEDNIQESELQKAIQHCINALDKKFRTVLVLVDVEGLDYETASEAVGRPLGTVKSRLARARERVQNCLQGFWELLPDLFRLNDEDNQ